MLAYSVEKCDGICDEGLVCGFMPPLSCGVCNPKSKKHKAFGNKLIRFDLIRFELKWIDLTWIVRIFHSYYFSEPLKQIGESCGQCGQLGYHGICDEGLVCMWDWATKCGKCLQKHKTHKAFGNEIFRIDIIR